MYLFSRSTRLGPGNVREATAWAVGITEKVNQITELELSLWTPVFSPGVGTLLFSAIAADLEVLENAQAKLMVDDGYVAEIERGAAFVTGGADDSLLQPVYGEIDPNRRPQYVTVAASQLAPGQFAKGIEVGIEIAQRVEKISGHATSFCVSSTGQYGGVAWITAFDDVKTLEASEQAVNGDPGFMQLVDSKGSKSFVAAVTTQTVLRRIV